MNLVFRETLPTNCHSNLVNWACRSRGNFPITLTVTRSSDFTSVLLSIQLAVTMGRLRKFTVFPYQYLFSQASRNLPNHRRDFKTEYGSERSVLSLECTLWQQSLKERYMLSGAELTSQMQSLFILSKK